MEIIGPTLKILAQKIGVDLTNISTILMSRNGGYMIANLVGASLQNIVRKCPECLLSIAFLIATIGLLKNYDKKENEFLFNLVVIITPLISSLTIVSILFFFQGISQGITDLGLFFSKEEKKECFLNFRWNKFNVENVG